MAEGDVRQNLGQGGGQKLSVTQQQTPCNQVRKAGRVQMRACHSCTQEDLALPIASEQEYLHRHEADPRWHSHNLMGSHT